MEKPFERIPLMVSNPYEEADDRAVRRNGASP